MNKIMEHFRFVELIIRKFYYSFDFIHEFMSHKYEEISKIERGSDSKKCSDWNKIASYIDSLGIKKGDILIIHSSADGMRKVNVQPKEIINYLFGLIGETGTLVMAAYPNLDKIDENGDILYDPRRTAVSTGLLPFIFCRMKNTIRSNCPLNSLAANGYEAKAIMKHNLEGDLAFGSGSAWDYCVQKHAKILFLGVPIYHSNTVTHVVEDLMGEAWPIKNWYETKQYRIKTENGEIIREFRNRRQFWAKYTTQHWNTALYKKNNLLKETVIDDVSIGYNPDAYQLVEFLKNRVLNNKLPFVIPRRYWK